MLIANFFAGAYRKKSNRNTVQIHLRREDVKYLIQYISIQRKLDIEEVIKKDCVALDPVKTDIAFQLLLQELIMREGR